MAGPHTTPISGGAGHVRAGHVLRAVAQVIPIWSCEHFRELMPYPGSLYVWAMPISTGMGGGCVSAGLGRSSSKVSQLAVSLADKIRRATPSPPPKTNISTYRYTSTGRYSISWRDLTLSSGGGGAQRGQTPAGGRHGRVARAAESPADRGPGSGPGAAACRICPAETRCAEPSAAVCYSAPHTLSASHGVSIYMPRGAGRRVGCWHWLLVTLPPPPC